MEWAILSGLMGVLIKDFSVLMIWMEMECISEVMEECIQGVGKRIKCTAKASSPGLRAVSI